uniref:Ring finger protein 122 n=1 Tax=Aquila chrysaetos chrysaetos TaxID=223781 RepID=A0A663E6T6_AQUCH
PPLKPCTMPPITFQDLPLNIYMVIFGTGIFVFVLTGGAAAVGRHPGGVPGPSQRPVVLSQNTGTTCAVCLEDFKVKEELGVLPCQHAFHRKCLVKWLEVRCVCPMCNKPMAGPAQPRRDTPPPPPAPG